MFFGGQARQHYICVFVTTAKVGQGDPLEKNDIQCCKGTWRAMDSSSVDISQPSPFRVGDQGLSLVVGVWNLELWIVSEAQCGPTNSQLNSGDVEKKSRMANGQSN